MHMIGGVEYTSKVPTTISFLAEVKVTDQSALIKSLPATILTNVAFVEIYRWDES